MNHILAIKNYSNVLFFFVISCFYYLFNKSLEMKDILWKKIKLYVSKQTAVLGCSDIFTRTNKMFLRNCTFFQRVKSYAIIFGVISDMIFHMKVGHAKSSIYSPDLPMRNCPLQLRTDTSETLMMNIPLQEKIQPPWLTCEAVRLRS